MSSTPSKSKKPRVKPPRGRPVATSAISHPAVEDSSALAHFSSFSPDGLLFAHISLAVDKHRLRVYDTITRQSIAEHVVDSAQVTSSCWVHLRQPDATGTEAAESMSQPKKKRKKRNSLAVDAASVSAPASQVVVLGLSNGSLDIFSPSHGRVTRTLSHSLSTTAILSISPQKSSDDSTPLLWTSGADGSVRVWDVWKNIVTTSWNSGERIPYSCVAIKPENYSDDEDRTDFLVANHSIRLLSLSSSSDEMQLDESSKPTELADFTGHASPVKGLHWHGKSTFLSLAEADRFIYLWELPESPSSQGKIIASIPLDSDARSVALSPQQDSILALSASGKLSIFTLPSDSTSSSPTKGKAKIPTLTPASTITVSTKASASNVQIVAASFVAANKGQVRVVGLAAGVRPVFDVVTYLDKSGSNIPDVPFFSSGVGLVNGEDETIGAPTKRYTESSSLAVQSGADLGHDASMDDLPMRDVDGALDIDLAELSLGQRLTALSNPADVQNHDSSEDEDEENAAPRAASSKRNGDETITGVPAGSLTRTLIQALHSSDARLLEMCLAHSDEALIRNTVRRLPPQLAVPLITSCAERLGRGARASNMKGGGGGASSQRGTALVNWTRAVLVSHSGHLMTMPDLVARLSGLHATLTTRLALQDSLLSLSGRLDMVVSQIEMRSSGPPAPLAVPKGKSQKTRRQAKRYVEGESEEEEEEKEVEVESGEEDGSVEDVVLGGDDEDEDDEDEEEDEDEDEEDEDEEDDIDDDESDGGGPKLNGFIDDEAEEFSGDESSESD